MMRLHHLTPSMAKSILRPSINQNSWGAVLCKDAAAGALSPRVSGCMGDIIIDLPVEGHDPSHRAHGDILAASRLQIRNPPASGWRFWR